MSSENLIIDVEILVVYYVLYGTQIGQPNLLESGDHFWLTSFKVACPVCRGYAEQTRMHSSRIHTTLSLTVSHSICCGMHPPPPTLHAPLCHTCPRPCMPPCHACPPPHMPPTMHAPCHACPPPHMPPCHACLPATHAPTPQHVPCMPPCGQTDTCKNITSANFVSGR